MRFSINKRGFSLIEVLIVVLILGILATLALPMFQEAKEKAMASRIFLEINQIEKAAMFYCAEHDSTPLIDVLVWIDSENNPLSTYNLPKNDGPYYYGVRGSEWFFITVWATKQWDPSDCLVSVRYYNGGQIISNRQWSVPDPSITNPHQRLRRVIYNLLKSQGETVL